MNIKPCPFCGDSTNIFTSSRGKVGSTLKYNKVCKNCNSEGPVAYLRSDGTNFYLKSVKFHIQQLISLLKMLQLMNGINGLLL